MRLGIRFVALLACLLTVTTASAQDTPVKSFPAFGEAFTSRISPDGTLLATFESGVIHNDEIIADYLPIRVYDVTHGEAVATLTGEPDYAVDIAFSADGSKLAALYPTGWLYVWTMPEGDSVARLPIAPNTARLAWVGDTNSVAIAAGVLPQVQIWDTETGYMTAFLTNRFATIAEQREAYSSSAVPDGLSAFDVAPDGSVFAVATMYGRVQFWQPDGTITTIYDPELETPNLPIRTLKFTADSSRLVALNSTDGIVFVFDVATGDLLNEIDTSGARMTALAVSPDGERAAWLAETEDEGVKVVIGDPVNGITAEIPIPNEDSSDWRTPMTSLFFSADGQRLILSGRFLRGSAELDPSQNPVYIIPLPR